MQTPARVNLSEIVDNSKVGPFQTAIFILCGLCLIMDGFDVQAMGYVAPALTRDWHIPNAMLGPVFSSALVGVLVGSLLLSMVADRIGRRPVLLGAAFLFSALTILTARVNTIGQLLTVRFVAGVFLGSLMPNAMALVGEYSPRRIRITVMMIVATGFTAGAAIGGFISAWLIPAFGWRAVFYFGGSIPFVLSILMFFFLPESLQFLALHGGDPRRIGNWLKRIDPTAPAPASNTQYIVLEQKQKGVPMVTLFREGRGLGTVLLWVINFMNLLNLYFLASWLPTVVRDAGYSTSQAVLVGTTLQVAGTIGAVALGWFVHRWGFVAVLVPGFACACVSIALIGQPGFTLALIFLAVFVAGFFVVGGQSAVNALAATYYPTDLRSTGIGSGLGVGRIGAIVGPVVGGEMMALHWSTHQLFLAAAVPALISAVVMVGMRWPLGAQARPDAKGAVMVH